MTIERKRAKIGDNELKQIADYSIDFRDLPRTELAKKMQNEIPWQGKIPEIEVLERKITEYRHKLTDRPEDKPWSIATLDNNPITPEALLVVITEYRRKIEKGFKLTIREAKWISRLFKMDLIDEPNGRQPKLSNKLGSTGITIAYLVAKTEQICEITGQAPDLEIYDKLLAGLPAVSEHWEVLLAAFASNAGILVNDLTKPKDEKIKGGVG